MFVLHPCLLYCHMFVLLMNILGCNLDFRVSYNNKFIFNTNVSLINQCNKPYCFSMHTSLVMHVFYMNYEYQTIQRELSKHFHLKLHSFVIPRYVLQKITLRLNRAKFFDHQRMVKQIDLMISVLVIYRHEIILNSWSLNSCYFNCVFS